MGETQAEKSVLLAIREAVAKARKLVDDGCTEVDGLSERSLGIEDALDVFETALDPLGLWPGEEKTDG